MLTAVTTQALLGSCEQAIALIRPDGDIIFENEPARTLWAQRAAGHSLLDRLTVASRWSEIVLQLSGGDPVTDEPVLLRTVNNDADLAYLTALPQNNAQGDLDSVLCIWSARRNGLSGIRHDLTGETVSGYTRDLEAILEHRTYQHMLVAEQDEHARQVLDHLSVGILIANPGGNILYRNQAMSDVFGFRALDLPELHVRYCMSPAAQAMFQQVADTGLRGVVVDLDLGGCPAQIELLPMTKAGDIEQIVLQYSRVNSAA